MSNWKKHQIRIDKVRGTAEHYMDGMLRSIVPDGHGGIVTFREISLIDDCISIQIAHTKRIGFYKKEIGYKDDKIAKLKKQIIQLQERCDKAELPAAYVFVERKWEELQKNDFIAYYFDDEQNLLWRAEKRELTNENGIRIDDMEKLDVVLEESEGE